MTTSADAGVAFAMPANDNAPKISIVDAMMGAGKTTAMHRMMKEEHEEALRAAFTTETPPPTPRFLYVTPFLDEIDRVIDACPDLRFEQPDDTVMPSKAAHLEALIAKGANIATTHALFPKLSEQARRNIAAYGYTLVIDEAVEAVSTVDLTQKQRDWLIEKNCISIDPETGLVSWTVSDKFDTRYDDIRDKCEAGTVHLFRDRFFIYRFPIEMLDAFPRVYVLTYLFEGSLMAALMRSVGMPYRKQSVEDGELVPFDSVDERVLKQEVRRRLKIDRSRRNDIGARRRGGSKRASEKLTNTWFREKMTEPDALAIQRALYAFVRHGAKVKTTEALWTVTDMGRNRPKLTHPQMKGDDKFLQINARATNEYAKRRALAYLSNRFLVPHVKDFLREVEGVEINEDLWALSEMLQWLWRGCIRDPKDPAMHVFVPSERMRSLLAAWVESDSEAELVEKISLLRHPQRTAA